MDIERTTARAIVRLIPSWAFAVLNAVGVTTASAIAVHRPEWRAMGLLGVAAGAAGLWGIAERALDELDFRGTPPDARTYRPYAVLQAFSAIVAVAAVIGFAIFGPGAFFFGDIGVGSG